MAVPQTATVGTVVDLLPPAGMPAAGGSRDEGEQLKSVLGKVRLILEAFSLEEAELSLSELVRHTGLAKATVHRLCHELLEWGMLDRSGTRYRLGLRLFEIGQRVALQRIMRDAARGFMEDLLRDPSIHAVHLAVPSGLEVLYIEKLTGHGRVSPSYIAGRMPLHCTATGRAILAYSGARLLEEVIAAGLHRRTAHTCGSSAQLRRELARVGTEGIATETEEVRLGYMSIAVPLFAGSGTVVGALSVTMPTVRANLGRVSVALRAAGTAVNRALRSYEV